MGLLDSGLDRSLYASFKGKLLRGVIRRAVISPDAELDDDGDPAVVSPIDTPIEGFPEAYSRNTMATAGIPSTDLKLNIFAASMPGVSPQVHQQVRLDRRAGVNVTSQWYEIRGPIAIDPANVLWVCQSFEIPAP